MGAPYRVVNSKVGTAPTLKVEDKDRVNNSRRIKTVKLNIIKLKASVNKFSQGKLVIKVECLSQIVSKQGRFHMTNSY